MGEAGAISAMDGFWLVKADLSMCSAFLGEALCEGSAVVPVAALDKEGEVVKGSG